jgi:adenosylcobinamide-GDP ribazoletransferase
LVEGLKTVLALMTRLPVRLDGSGPSIAAASGWFPVVGALVGLVAGLVFAALTLAGVPSFPAAIVVLAVLALLTGALHEDGLADCADALGPHDRSRRLEVMRDSRIGTFGALALILVTLLRLAGLSSLWDPVAQVATLVVVGALSRGLLVPTMALLPPARRDGLGAAAGRPDRTNVLSALALPLLLAFTLLPADRALVVVAAAIVASVLWAWVAQRSFGGQSGDVLGAQQQLAEAAMLLAVTTLR